MKLLMEQKYFARLFQLCLALIPALEGWLGFLNDIEGYTSTLQKMIIPLLSMQGVQPEFLDSWRAIHSPIIQKVAYCLMFTFEGLIGLFATLGILKMVWCFNKNHAAFIAAQTWARAACLLGTLLWGVGFFVVGGDYFLCWQNNDISYLQTAGLNYMLVMAVPYILLKKYEHSQTM